MPTHPDPVILRSAARVEPDPAAEAIYAVSHDLRGPLLNVQGFLQRLRRSWDTLEQAVEQWDLTAEQRQLWRQVRHDKIGSSFQILEQNARRMEQLLESLLLLSRVGREPLEPERFPVEEVVARVAAELGLRLAETGATLESGPLPVVWSDRARLEEIYRQLLDNAVKFLSPARPGLIRVGGSSEPVQAILWVQDNGIGIRPQDQERLFLPFGRLREIDVPGCGVGLAVVRKLVHQQGGRVWLQSVHQQGTTVFFSLPAVS